MGSHVWVVGTAACCIAAQRQCSKAAAGSWPSNTRTCSSWAAAWPRATWASPSCCWYFSPPFSA
eukprot:scaffold271154_cov17-Tisochrysis_lutea.AAC.1